KAFTADQHGTPLHVAFGGYRRGRIYLRVGDSVYDQTSLEPALPHLPPFPYAELEVTQTTWKEWPTAHPHPHPSLRPLKPPHPAGTPRAGGLTRPRCPTRDGRHVGPPPENGQLSGGHFLASGSPSTSRQYRSPASPSHVCTRPEGQRTLNRPVPDDVPRPNTTRRSFADR